MSDDADALDQSTAALSRQLLTDSESLTTALRHVAVLACDVLAAAGSASITLWGDGDQPRTVAFTDDVDLALDEAQYDVRTGPCLEAIRGAKVIRIDSMAD